MEPVTLTLMGIAVLFFLVLVVKSTFNLKKVCAICLSVVLTWITLLILLYSGVFIDKIIIAILMGHTSLGLYYTWEKNVKEKFAIFRLPVLLTFIFVIYTLLEGFATNTGIFLAILWVLFLLVYLSKFNTLTKKLIECCKKW